MRQYCRLNTMCECGEHSGPNSVSQSLDELEFERGLWSAAQYGDLDRALHLLNKGFGVDQRDAAGYTPLHYAARNGHLDICKLLVAKGACLDAVTCQGKATPLHRAATVGKFEIVKFLVENKANCRLKDADGKTALHRAAANKHLKICQYLLEVEPSLRNEVDIHEKRPADYVQTTEFLSLLN
ncbi:ankyrin repeat domain-containing protein 39 isoform X1 [Tribolium castaneum]|nr:PREDICTED: ankyrin repeat domain-containing protein 39 isoform X1 [Tribolium castaneum]|eukprot:XP_015835535.1 PREDICTED: ankyrin repeat domain-containing protein 39 isoform X1 [Tribolium castaneum]